MATVPFHAQNLFESCAAACAQMLLHWHSRRLGDDTIFPADQKDLYNKLHAIPQSTPFRGTVFVSPVQLQAGLNQRWKADSASGTRAVTGSHAPWDLVAQPVTPQGPTTLMQAMDASLNAGLPCVVSVNTNAHWIVVDRRRTEQTGGEAVYEYMDPWLESDADGSSPRATFIHSRRASCRCGNGSRLITTVWRRRGMNGRLETVTLRLLYSWPFGRHDETPGSLRQMITDAKWAPGEKGTAPVLYHYAVAPAEVLPPAPASRPAPRRKGRPPALLKQLEAAGFCGTGAAAGWRKLDVSAPAESREVRCLTHIDPFYTLHFFPGRTPRSPWLAAVVLEDGWLLEAAVVHGARPSLANAEAAAEQAVRVRKTIVFPDGMRWQMADCSVAALPGLVWLACLETRVPYLPLVQVNVTPAGGGASRRVFLTISGRVYSKLTFPGPA